MDSMTIDKRGYSPIKPILAEIDKIKNYKDLLQYSATHPLEGGNTFIGIH
jgi:putative endopeptidase